MIILTIIDLLITANKGISEVSKTRDALKRVFPDEPTYSDQDLISKYIMATGFTREKLKRMIEE